MMNGDFYLVRWWCEKMRTVIIIITDVDNFFAYVYNKYIFENRKRVATRVCFKNTRLLTESCTYRRLARELLYRICVKPSRRKWSVSNNSTFLARFHDSVHLFAGETQRFRVHSRRLSTAKLYYYIYYTVFTYTHRTRHYVYIIYVKGAAHPLHDV